MCQLRHPAQKDEIEKLFNECLELNNKRVQMAHGSGPKGWVMIGQFVIGADKRWMRSTIPMALINYIVLPTALRR